MENETQTRIDTIADQQRKDLSEFLQKNKDKKAKIILEINDNKVACIFELSQVNELADKFNIDVFPLMINQLLIEHVNGAKGSETITEIPTTI